MNALIEEDIKGLREKVAVNENHFFYSEDAIAKQDQIKQAISICLADYEQNEDDVSFFKQISQIIDNDVKYLAALDQETDAYLPLLLSLRENVVLSLIRQLNLSKAKAIDSTVIINALANIYSYLQHHFKNSDWFDNPQAYETTRLSNFKILAEIDEQPWSTEVYQSGYHLPLVSSSR